MADELQETLLALTADIVAAHVSNNSVGMADLPTLIGNVHAALAGLGTPVEAPVEEQKPAVSIRASVKPDHVVCLEDGKKFTTLKRHLMTDHGLDRKRGVEGKSVSVRVDPGGRRCIKKKKT